MILEKIKCILEFGSYSRGDSDCYSDYDICVVTYLEEHLNVINLELLKKHVQLPSEQINKASLVIYDEQTFTKMIQDGSLFIWHLKNEAKVLFGGAYFLKNIKDVKPFNRHLDDLNYHNEILQDLCLSYKNTRKETLFDLSLMFTIARNVCILLCNKIGENRFGRIDAFETCLNKFDDFPLSTDEYNFLLFKKMHYERGFGSNNQLKEQNFKNLLIKIKQLVTYAREKLTDRLLFE